MADTGSVGLPPKECEYCEVILALAPRVGAIQAFPRVTLR